MTIYVKQQGKWHAYRLRTKKNALALASVMKKQQYEVSLTPK